MMMVSCVFQTDEEVVQTVKMMRSKFDGLLQGSNTADLSPGQMLLMGFNGLFTRLDADFTSMLDATAQLDVPDCWSKIDVVKEARSMQVRIYCFWCCLNPV